MTESQSILNRFYSNFGFYISGPILTKYMIPHQISTNPNTSNLKISTNSNAYISNNSQLIWVKPILVKFWILHLMTNPNKVYDTTPNLNHLKSQLISTTSNAYISDNSQPILFKLWILHPRTNPNKVFNTKPNLK